MPAAASRHVYFFGAGKADGHAGMKDLLGGKGANLAEMVNLGIPVPPGFTIATTACAEYERTQAISDALRNEVDEGVAKVEAVMKRRFGNTTNPLLFSVRSGAAASMPGMMDTVLNLGLNDETVAQLAAKNPQFAYDSYRRFITMYSDVVMQLGREDFEHEITHLKQALNVKFDSEIPAAELQKLCTKFKAIYKSKTGGSDFPQEPRAQLFASIKAVFRSWGNPRAVAYRQMYNIKGLIGTAVNVQAMVFGNFNSRSATGVAFSRSPSDGTKFFYGEYLINAQGEDVVAGIRTPQQLTKKASMDWAKGHEVSEAERAKRYPSMEESMPKLFSELCDIKDKLELRYRDMQDLEFTVEDGRLWMLQCRNAKRTIRASVTCAVDLVKEGLISEEEAVLRIDPLQVDHLLHPTIDSKAVPKKPLAKGLAASPGAAVGQIVFNATDAEKAAAANQAVIMVRLETSPEDLKGMAAARGILTARGGMTSHAAVVARGMGKTCVAGVADLVIQGNVCILGGKTFKEGEWITLDGSKGYVYEGRIPLVQPSIRGDFDTIISWCKKYKRLGVRANADIPKDAHVARQFGAEGVGLCRTEHMFFEGDRITAMREMILATTEEGQKKALAKVLPLQRDDFIGIFREMKGLPVTIRLLDPPLHEFVPHDERSQRLLSQKTGIPFEQVVQRVKELHEENPMLGHRGVRLGLSHPEIYNMQVQAIIEAAVACKAEKIDADPEIMIPLVGKREELAIAKANAIKTAERVLAAAGTTVKYTIGTMIEVPRAAITADDIAQEADFFSFGTNDLTQMGCGFSRDDAGPFLKHYLSLGIYEKDPFQSIDQAGIGQLIEIAIRKGRSVKPLLKIGICGEHGGDPSSISFCHAAGMNYVSCSPYRVPVAIVAAAHANLLEQRAVSAERKRLAGVSKL